MKEVDLKQSWPFLSKRPIPLHYFLLAQGDADKVFSLCRNNPDGFNYLNKYPISEDDRIQIHKYCDLLCNLNEYQVSCNIIDKATIESETEDPSYKEESTSLEVLFNRLNTGGTRITPDDLSYSAIKAYWPEIKDLNDTIAEEYISPSKLVMLAFRYALREREPMSFPAPLSIKKIRLLSRDSSAEKIRTLYGASYELSPLQNLLREADNLLRENGLPAYIRNSICYNSPDAFLLLLQCVEEHNLPRAFIRGLILYLHWFSYKAKQKDIVDKILAFSKEVISIESVQQALTFAIANEWLIPLESSERFSNLFSIKGESRWTPWTIEGNAPWIDLFARIYPWNHYEPREMLLYCQRDYINSHFLAYDPARQDLWEDSNRPWDYDHIIPQEWVNGKYNCAYRWYCQTWLNCIGNIAAIPFEINRRKSNRTDFDEYKDNADKLFFDSSKYEQLNQDMLTVDELHAKPFAELTWHRMCLLYEKIYELIEPVLSSLAFSPNLEKRKRIFEAVIDVIPGAVVGFVAKDREFPIENTPLNWARNWISVGLEKRGYFACASWGINQNYIEFGLRKQIGENGVIPVDKRKDLPREIDGFEVCLDNDWWYFWKEEIIDEHITPHYIVNTIKILSDQIG